MNVAGEELAEVVGPGYPFTEVLRLSRVKTPERICGIRRPVEGLWAEPEQDRLDD